METLKNSLMEIAIKEHGAELSSIVCNGTEYLWNADPAFWKRHSPVLFPIIGNVWGGKFKVEGKEYPMGQHGFARDMDFTLLSKSEDSIFYVLESSEETLAKFPFPFRLEIGYELNGKSIKVIWRVINTGTGTLPFQIGAHPAFYYPEYDPSTLNRGSFTLESDSEGQLEYILIGDKGCPDITRRYPSEKVIDIQPSTFDKDALIFDRHQVRKVTLNTPSGKPWLSLSFSTPLVGLWSPVGKNAPFVCIEPWYGRGDRAGYEGEFSLRDEIQTLEAGKTFEANYTITIE